MESSRKKLSTDAVLATVGGAFRKYCRPGDRVIVAFSGGLDSSVLLHALSHRGTDWAIGTLGAVHVHHGLSPDADRWSAHCAEMCREWKVPLEIKRVSVVPTNGEGLEAAARDARYQALADATADWVLLAHHQDDQAETLLLNLFRGAGPKGMAAMGTARGRYLRPMLDLPRAAILSYARAAGIRWVEDESNTNESYTRNFLRRRVFPIVREQFPSISANLGRSAQLFQVAGALLDDLARLDLGEAPLSTDRLRLLTPSRALNLLAYKLREEEARIPSRAQLEELLRQLLDASGDGRLRFVFGDREVRRFHHRVYVLRNPLKHPAPSIWSGEECVRWGDASIRILRSVGQGVSERAVRESTVTFSCRRGGESLQLYPNASRRKVKALLREAGVPPWVRDRLPLMFVGNRLAWVAGIGVAEEYRCGPEEMGISLEFDGLNW